ncbi:MAG: hypothetical protein AAGB14_06380, partial [Verrucomicrobiota bacterium]
MPQVPLRDRILQLMRSSDYRPMNKSDLSRTLKIPANQRAKLRKELKALENAGQIVLGQKSRYQTTADDGSRLRGYLKFTPKGDAWFFPD